jgi:PAS domain S-box-containing protein/putative nucleotidyltransferase with HDIG domain
MPRKRDVVEAADSCAGRCTGAEAGPPMAKGVPAEEALRAQADTAASPVPEDIAAVVHDLRVHQIELEMQNEELRRAELELKSSRQEYFDLYDLAPVGYVTLTEKDIILRANLTAARELGVERSELLGTSITRFILREDQDIYYLHHKRLFAGREPQPCELRVMRADGVRLWVHIDAILAHDDSDGGPASRVTLTDITAMKTTEEALRESEERDSEIVEHGGVGVAYFSLEGRVLLLNRQAVRNLGGSDSSEFVGKSLTELFGDEAGGEYLARIRKTAASPEALTYEDHAELPGGPRWLSSIHTRSLDAAGNVVGVHVYAQDITELRQAEQTAAERSHVLEELLEAIPVPVHYKDAALRYVGCNEAFARSLDRSRDEIIGKSVFDLHPAALAKRYDASDRELLAHPEQAQENQTEIPGEGAASRYVLTHKAVFSDVDGKPAGIVGVDLDVTEIRQAEREIAAGAVQLRLTLEATVAALGSTTEMRDPYTAGHQRRVAELAGAIAAELRWGEGQVESLRTAALLHDIGKIVVPAEILSKPGSLTEVEMQLIRQHAVAGADTVADIDFEGAVAEMIRQHHERLDGSGYPAGLSGAEILPEARVLAVADVVEAMISHRPYRPALPVEEALAEVESGAGVRYGAEAVAACVKLFRERRFTLAD